MNHSKQKKIKPKQQNKSFQRMPKGTYLKLGTGVIKISQRP